MAFIKAYDTSTGGARGEGRASLIQFFQNPRGRRITKSTLEKEGLVVRPQGFMQKQMNAAKAALAIRNIEANPLLKKLKAPQKIRKLLAGHGEFREHERMSYFEDDNNKHELEFYTGKAYEKLRSSSIDVSGWNGAKRSWLSSAVDKASSKLDELTDTLADALVNKIAIGIDKATNPLAVPLQWMEGSWHKSAKFSRAGFAESLLKEALAAGVLSAPAKELPKSYVDWCGDLATKEYEKTIKTPDATSPFRRQLDLGNLQVQQEFAVKWEDLFEDRFKETKRLRKWMPDTVNLLPLFFESGRAIPSFDVLRYCKPAAAASGLAQLQSTLDALSSAGPSGKGARGSNPDRDMLVTLEDEQVIRDAVSSQLQLSAEAFLQSDSLSDTSERLQSWDKKDRAYNDGKSSNSRALQMVKRQIAVATRPKAAVVGASKAVGQVIKEGAKAGIEEIRKELGISNSALAKTAVQ